MTKKINKFKYGYFNKCENCKKIFESQKASTRFHSDDCMKEYYDKKRKKEELLPLKNVRKGL